MDVDQVVDGLMPYLSAVASAYGGAVVERVGQESIDAAAGATVGVGRRVLRRLLAVRGSSETIGSAVADLGEEPDDEDLRALLRARVGNALRADKRLCVELADLLARAGTGVVAAGARSVAAHTVSGVVVTGDHSTLLR